MFFLAAHASPAQLTALIGLIAGDRELIHGEFEAPLGVVRVRRRWEEIAQVLNALPNAPVQRNGEKWKSVSRTISLLVRKLTPLDFYIMFEIAVLD